MGEFDIVIESPHPYKPSQANCYQIEFARARWVEISFHEQCEMEKGCDYVFFEGLEKIGFHALLWRRQIRLLGNHILMRRHTTVDRDSNSIQNEISL